MCSIAKEPGGVAKLKRRASMIRLQQLSLDQCELKMLIPLRSLLAQAGMVKPSSMPLNQVCSLNRNLFYFNLHSYGNLFKRIILPALKYITFRFCIWGFHLFYQQGLTFGHDLICFVLVCFFFQEN